MGGFHFMGMLWYPMQFARTNGIFEKTIFILAVLLFVGVTGRSTRLA